MLTLRAKGQYNISSGHLAPLPLLITQNRTKELRLTTCTASISRIGYVTYARENWQMERFKVKDEPMDALAIDTQVMDENIVSVVLKEEPGDRFDPDYMEDICSGTFEKVFLPIENNEVDFSNEMVKLELEGESSSHQNWTTQIANPSLCDKEDNTAQRCLANANFVQTQDLEKHPSFCTNGQQPKFYKIQCSVCKKWFLNNDSMVTHLRMHCGGNQCEVCQQSFQDSSSLHAHMLTHVGMSPLECNICQKRFAYKWCLRSHMQMHVLEKPYDGDALQQSFMKRPGPNNEHMLNMEEKPLECDLCHTTFKEKIHLNRHMLTHTEDRPFKCEICFAAFREKAKLNMHMLLHTGNKQFKCTMCHRSFAQKTALNNHMLAHSGEKPHACNICEKTYKRKSELIRHTMVHTGERPYECKECLMTFREKAKLNSHMLVHTAGTTWIYPENYPLREYQFEIVQTALYNNTLICLPTGLGKTFIAAVLMYNFWRWYPRGKIIFLAPTKPLVAQQIDACHNIMGIPSKETVELTGAIPQKQRENAWSSKRVVFATPQVFHNDLDKNIVPSELVKCVVIDEAHRALGKHSYCECIKILCTKNEYFRVLALSATPGNKIDNVHEVLQNLRISHLELRDETSPDVSPYINHRKVDIILVPLSNELAKFKERYIIIMDRHVKYIIQNNVLRGHTANISKGRIFYLVKEFQKKSNRSSNYGQIMKTLNILLTMYHAYELMVRHGLRAFHRFYQNHSDKFWMNDEIQLLALLDDIESYLGPFPNVQPTPNGVLPDIPQDIVFGHNKFHKLKELLLVHFKRAEQNQRDTRAIVFVEYRDIVNEVYVLLLQSRPLIRPQMFVGQAGQKQRHQIKALEDFKGNHVNVLISTSIGEEGLDVGEVDLIICFDISQQSPTRLVQRMGRTGRKRDGHIIVLVTDGKEHETLKSTMARRDSLNNKILNTSNIFASLYQDNPRMIPSTFKPECRKMYLSVQPKSQVVKRKGKKNVEKKKIETDCTKGKDIHPVGVKGENRTMMAKFLTNAKCNKPQEDSTDIIAFRGIQGDHKKNTIKPSEVKLLTSDNDALHFLTLCAMQNSQKELQTKKTDIMDLTYVPVPPRIDNFLNFTLPNIETLDVSSLLAEMINYCEPVQSSKAVDNDNVTLDVYPEDDEFWCINPCEDIILQNTTTSECLALGESKFEDLLDDSSDSDVLIPSVNEKNMNNYQNPNTDDVMSPKKHDNSKSPEIHNTTVLEDFEPGIFEDILNDSSDSVNSDTHSYITKDTNYVKRKLDTEAIEIDDSNVKNSTRLYDIFSPINTEKANDKLKSSCNVLNETTNKFMDCMQTEAGNVTLNQSNVNTSMLSITQALAEISRINKTDNCLNASKPNIMNENQIHNSTTILQNHPECSFAGVINTIDIQSEDDMFASDDDFSEYSTKKEGTSTAHISSKDEALNIEESFKMPPQNIKSVSSILENDLENDNKNVEIDDFEWDSECEINSTHNVQECKTTTPYNTALIRSKQNASGGLAKKLSNIKLSSTHNSCVSKESQNDMDNSDDDFIMTIDDVKKLSEMESSYFCNTPKRFDVKLTNASTPNDNGNSILSLSRQKGMKTALTDTFAAPAKYQNGNKLSTGWICTAKQKPTMSLNRDRTKPNNKKKYRRRIRSEFIDDEAQVSSDGTPDESSGTDEDLTDFVSYTQTVKEEVDMQAHYLQTIKSPIKRPGTFLFKKPRSPSAEVEIYSQAVSQVQESYLYDSFCVNGDDIEQEESEESYESTIIEQPVELLERRKRKRAHAEKFAEFNRRRVSKKQKLKKALNNSMSSEDETEKLRKQIQDESIFLKKVYK
ncbi:hypothetical protein KM043_004287 [Ampulex compressa]|nr:hypothetical protein KM043_004287 [Ampulex compressa]